MKISIIVAADENYGIGKGNQLLCHLPADLKYFKQITQGHAILMGRKTHESIGKPLPNRSNIIISSSNLPKEACFVFDSIEKGIEFCKQAGEEELFIIGGDSIYKQSIHLADKIYLTRIHHSFEADAFFPVLPPDEWQLDQQVLNPSDEKNAWSFTFETYHRIKHK